MNLIDGVLYVGELTALESKPWANDPSKANYELVLTKVFKDKYENENRQYIRVSIGGEEVADIQKLIAQSKGKRVAVPVVTRVKYGISQKTGKPYGFLESFKPRESQIQVVQ